MAHSDLDVNSRRWRVADPQQVQQSGSNGGQRVQTAVQLLSQLCGGCHSCVDTAQPMRNICGGPHRRP